MFTPPHFHRYLQKSWILVLLIGPCFMVSSCGNLEPPALPNVLFIAIDDLNDWVGVMDGHPDAYTPNIDRLSARGTLFLNAHTQAPLCGPSRASLMSGLRPSTTGIYGQIRDHELRSAHPLLNNIEFLPEYLGNRGYETLGVGKLFHNHAPDSVFETSGGRVPGFGPIPEKRRHWDRKGTSTDWIPFPEADSLMPDYQSASWAVQHLQQSRNRPFFLAVGFLRPHVPWYVPPKWFELHPPDSLRMPAYAPDDMNDIPLIGKRVAEVPMMPTTEWAIETGQWPAIVQSYLASVSFVDAQVGRVLNALDQSPHADNTIIVLFSDHGYHIGEKSRFAKHSLWERATRVPLIIAGPALKQNQQVTSPVELLDLYPTLLDLTNLPPNASNEGRSLLPLLKDPQTAWPYAAITSYGRNNHAIRTKHERYIRYEDQSEEYYDHRNDPNEWTNLAGDSSYKEAIEDLKSFLPATNMPWSQASSYDVIPYFMEQRAESVTGL